MRLFWFFIWLLVIAVIMIVIKPIYDDFTDPVTGILAAATTPNVTAFQLGWAKMTPILIPALLLGGCLYWLYRGFDDKKGGE